jgi:hypothetical protein
LSKPAPQRGPVTQKGSVYQKNNSSIDVISPHAGYRSTHHVLGAGWNEDSDAEDRDGRSVLRSLPKAGAMLSTANTAMGQKPPVHNSRCRDSDNDIHMSDPEFDAHVLATASKFSPRKDAAPCVERTAKTDNSIHLDGVTAPVAGVGSDDERIDAQVTFQPNRPKLDLLPNPLKSLARSAAESIFILSAQGAGSGIHPQRAAMLEKTSATPYEEIPDLVPQQYSQTGGNSVPVGNTRPAKTMTSRSNQVPPSHYWDAAPGALSRAKDWTPHIQENFLVSTVSASEENKRDAARRTQQRRERRKAQEKREVGKVFQFLNGLKNGMWIPGLRNPEEVAKAAIELKENMVNNSEPRAERAIKLKRLIQRTAKFNLPGKADGKSVSHQRSSSLVLDEVAVSRIKSIVQSTISEQAPAASASTRTYSKTERSSMLSNGASMVQTASATWTLEPNGIEGDMPGGLRSQPWGASGGGSSVSAASGPSGGQAVVAEPRSISVAMTAPLSQPATTLQQKIPFSSMAMRPHQMTEFHAEGHRNAFPYKVVPLPEFVRKGDFVVLCDLLCVSADFQFRQSPSNSAVLLGLVCLKTTIFNKEKVWEIPIEDVDNARTFDQATETLKRKAWDVVAHVSLWNDGSTTDPNASKDGVLNYIMDLYREYTCLILSVLLHSFVPKQSNLRFQSTWIRVVHTFQSLHILRRLLKPLLKHL